MKFLRDALDKQAPNFEKGGKYEKLHPLFEAHDTILFTPGLVTDGSSHVRDGLDQKRLMIMVVMALLPCFLMAMFNTGYQANAAIAAGGSSIDDWHNTIYSGVLGLSYAAEGESVSFLSLNNFILGAIFFLPVYVVTLAAGGIAEAVFCVIRNHPLTEGFLVTSALYALILPATIPLWQVALGILFGVIIGKEIFGGVGMNILNPALTGRAFLFFAYPAQISGDGPWLPFNPDSLDNVKQGVEVAGLPSPALAAEAVDGISGATYLSLAASPDRSIDWAAEEMAVGSAEWMNAFIGMIPGSMGETSTIACLIGAVILVASKIGSWRTMVGCALGTTLMALLLNGLPDSFENPMLRVPFYWHFVMGGWALGAVFMATDPVSSPFTEKGRFIYGMFIGFLVVLIRCVNPAYAEGMMLAILFMNMFAPLIDHFIVQANITRRMKRNAV
jgi:Na+-transporting NADH:ubiquinone oxidoreductase subunit B